MTFGSDGGTSMRLAWEATAGAVAPAHFVLEAGTMDAMAVLERARDVITTSRVIGDPYDKNGVTVTRWSRPAGAVAGARGRETMGRHWRWAQ